MDIDNIKAQIRQDAETTAKQLNLELDQKELENYLAGRCQFFEPFELHDKMSSEKLLLTYIGNNTFEYKDKKFKFSDCYNGDTFFMAYSHSELSVL